MKHLIFSVIFLSFLVPQISLAQQSDFATQEELEAYITSTSTSTSTTPGDEELEGFIDGITTGTNPYEQWYQQEGESYGEWEARIREENIRRAAAGETLLITPLEREQRSRDSFWTQIRNQRATQVQNNGLFDQIVSPKTPGIAGQTPLSVLLNQVFYVGLAIAVVLAIVMIVRGGVQYMTIDSFTSKDSGKRMIQAALGGLTLAFASILILNTINPNLTSLDLKFKTLEELGNLLEGGDDSPLASKKRTENFGSWDEESAEAWIKEQEGGTRSTDGRLVISVYSATGDAVTDSNTAEKRGNANNLLREGSVALSPDLIAKYQPQHGAEIFINGQSIGFYEDTTAKSYNGVTFANTVDIYDENGSLGSKNILNNVPAGEWDITFGPPRPQISNP